MQLVNQEYWDISNLEVTNTPELDNLEGYKKPGDAQRAGILVLGYEQNRTFNSVTIRNNYVHDVQTEYYLNLWEYCNQTIKSGRWNYCFRKLV